MIKLTGERFKNVAPWSEGLDLLEDSYGISCCLHDISL